MARPRKYELRWTGNIKPNGEKELVRVKIERAVVTYRCPECGYEWKVYPPDMRIICPKCDELGEWIGDKQVIPPASR